MTDYCISCSMPLTTQDVVGAELDLGMICIHCTGEDGNPKSCEDVFNGGVEFFLQSFHNADRALAERLTRRNMLTLPLWKDGSYECLQGDLATDEEHEAMLKKFSE